MRPINLIPQEERRSHGGGSRSGPLAYIVVGSLAILLLGVVMVVLASNQISDREDEVAALETRKRAAVARASQLVPYTNFEQVALQRTQAVSELADSRFDWARVIRQLSLVLPPKVVFRKHDRLGRGRHRRRGGGGRGGRPVADSGRLRPGPGQRRRLRRLAEGDRRRDPGRSRQLDPDGGGLQRREVGQHLPAPRPGPVRNRRRLRCGAAVAQLDDRGGRSTRGNG